MLEILVFFGHLLIKSSGIKIIHILSKVSTAVSTQKQKQLKKKPKSTTATNLMDFGEVRQLSAVLHSSSTAVQ